MTTSIVSVDSANSKLQVGGVDSFEFTQDGIVFTPTGSNVVETTLDAKLDKLVFDTDHSVFASAYSKAVSNLHILYATPTVNVTHEPPLGGGAVPTNGYFRKGLITGHLAIGNGPLGIDSCVGIRGDEYYTNVQQEIRGLSYVVRNTRTTADEPTLGWDYFAVVGAVTVEAGNTQEIIGNQKAVVGELYFNAPTTGSYVVRLAHNFQASSPAVGANVTITNWYGLVVNSPVGAGAITNGYGVYIQPITIASNAAAILLGGTGNSGRIKWPNVEITQNASNQFDIAGNTIWSSGSVGIGAAPLSTTKLFSSYTTSVTGSTEYGMYGRIIPSNTSGAVSKIGSFGQALPNTGYAGTGDVIGVQGQFNLLGAVTVATGKAIGVQGIASTAAAGTISNLVGLHSVVSNAGGATVTNGIGLLIDSHSAGTNQYGVYQAGSSLINRFEGSITANMSTAIPAGGTTGAGLKVSSTANFGVFFGSSAPTLSAAKGSLYMRSDGTTTNDRMYVNTDGSTGWTAVTTAS